ncbi:MAG: type II secretion system protein [Candidatus Gastranaerophilaceae bacterium]
MKKKKNILGRGIGGLHNHAGFSLAEVLIALGIIGIVSAMTIPTLINNKAKQETIAKLQKNYTILAQAIKLSEIDNGSVDYWDYSNAQSFYTTYLKPYLIIAQEYIGVAKPENIEYKTLNNQSFSTGASYYYSSTPKFILNDGTLMAISNLGSNYKIINVDVNGFNKPNQMGKDMFSLCIQPKYGLTPYGFGNAYTGDSFGTNYDRAIIMSNSNDSACNKAKMGTWCAALILLDGWQIKDDYPWN